MPSASVGAETGVVAGHAAASIASVAPKSPADRAGLAPGDALLAVNGHRVRDFIDYRYLCCAGALTLRVRRPDGGERLVRLEKGIDEDAGLRFDADVFDGTRACRNRCLFCFCDQLPPGLRPALYVKDDDYRLSFLHGNYISLTNLGAGDWRRIARQRLSPLYVSVHATAGPLRANLMGSPRAAAIMPQLWRLARRRVAFHAQVVLCPRLNDGPRLDETLSDLGGLGEALLSVAVVPVGLTEHRARLARLEPVDGPGAAAALEQVARWQRRFLARRGRRTVFAADELYFRAGASPPPAVEYEDFAQLEDGVGLTAGLWRDWRRERRRLPAPVPTPRRVAAITGQLGAAALAPLLRDAGRVAGLDCIAVAVPNRALGAGVTVAGLVTGRDIMRAATAADADLFLLPDVALRREDRAAAVAASARPGGRSGPGGLSGLAAPLLDGTAVGRLARHFGGRLAVVPATAGGLAQGIRWAAEPAREV